MSPGEYFDKITILVNKVFHCKEDHEVMWATIGLLELAGSSTGFTLEDWKKLANGLNGLRDANKQLWELEERVSDTSLSPEERLSLSDKIRELNYERWECKNWIDEQLDGTQEVKNYDSLADIES
jgi:hypothetical protein